jgi:hypothetical protein
MILLLIFGTYIPITKHAFSLHGKPAHAVLKAFRRDDGASNIIQTWVEGTIPPPQFRTCGISANTLINNDRGQKKADIFPVYSLTPPSLQQLHLLIRHTTKLD